MCPRRVLHYIVLLFKNPIGFRDPKVLHHKWLGTLHQRDAINSHITRAQLISTQNANLHQIPNRIKCYYNIYHFTKVSGFTMPNHKTQTPLSIQITMSVNYLFTEVKFSFFFNTRHNFKTCLQ